MSDISLWEPVIGLEVHVELNTKTKLFSCAPNRFGDEPNTNITEVCTGQPGSLPVLNREAVRKAVQFGCAINGKVSTFSRFDRKCYFYPDSPRNFQITQYFQPIIVGGEVIAEVDGKEMRFGLTQVHLEDDAGMLKHFSTFAGIDFNRAGVPLIEIVSDPCMHTPKEAVAFCIAVKAILQYIDASDCNMEEGSLRVDANISVRKKGETELRSRIEIKNMNSFSNMEMALKSEIERQINEYQRHPDKPHHEVIQQDTYRWDPDRNRTVLMRSKQSALDYLYFPEPDLLPIVLSESFIEEVRSQLPELPLQRERRYVRDLGLSPHSAFVLTSDKGLADYFEEALKDCSNGNNLCNWLIVEFSGRLKDTGKNITNCGIPATHVAALINMMDRGDITGRIAKDIADEMVGSPGRHPQDFIDANPNFTPLHDIDQIEPIVLQVLAENPQSIIDFKAGRDKALAFLVGQVMKRTSGKASPQVVNELMRKHL